MDAGLQHTSGTNLGPQRRALRNSSEAGNYSFNYTIGDGVDTVLVCSGLNISAIRIASPGVLPNATQNSSYTYTAAATGGTGQYTWSVNKLPGGLTLDSSTGLIGHRHARAGGLFLQADGHRPKQCFLYQDHGHRHRWCLAGSAIRLHIWQLRRLHYWCAVRAQPGRLRRRHSSVYLECRQPAVRNELPVRRWQHAEWRSANRRGAVRRPARHRHVQRAGHGRRCQRQYIHPDLPGNRQPAACRWQRQSAERHPRRGLFEAAARTGRILCAGLYRADRARRVARRSVPQWNDRKRNAPGKRLLLARSRVHGNGEWNTLRTTQNISIGAGASTIRPDQYSFDNPGSTSDILGYYPAGSTISYQLNACCAPSYTWSQAGGGCRRAFRLPPAAC